jgi:hypothetical protein
MRVMLGSTGQLSGSVPEDERTRWSISTMCRRIRYGTCTIRQTPGIQ